jgi:hypothetical protein
MVLSKFSNSIFKFHYHLIIILKFNFSSNVLILRHDNSNIYFIFLANKIQLNFHLKLCYYQLSQKS